MAPKKKPASPEPVGSTEPEVPEEEEEGPGKATFTFAVTKISNLPIELETCVVLTGPVRENRSGPVLSTSSGEEQQSGHEASDWQWEKSRSIRLVGQTLYDDIVSKPFVVSVFDVRAGNALVGRATLNLTPLLHDQLEVGGDVRLELSPEYLAKWFPVDAEQGGDVAPSTPLSDAPVTTIGVTVSVQDFVGPVEDRLNWVAVTLGVKGIFGLPPRMTGLGITGPDDIEFHQLKYQSVLMGETVDGGALAAPPEKRPDPPEEAEPGTEDPPEPAEDLPEDERRAQQERFDLSVRFAEGQVVRYRGASFVKEFRYMLNNTGGIWFYFNPEEKPATDPKKPNDPLTGNLAVHYAGKSWFELKDLIKPGARKVEKVVPLVSRNQPEETALEPTLESSNSFVRLTLELSRDVSIPEPPIAQVELSQLLTSQKGFNKFPLSNDAANLFKESVQRSFSTICNDSTGGGGEVQGVVDDLKRSGHYGDVKQDLRNAIVRIFRERLRKDPKMIPGKPLNADASEQFFSDSYAYLKEAMNDVLDDMQNEKVAPPNPQDDTASAGSLEDEAASDPFVAALRETAAARKSRESLSIAADARERCARLAYEAEMVGNWNRAANHFQNCLLIDENKLDPQIWIEYAKFCMRARGRQASAEEALQQAVQLLADDLNPISVSGETAMALDLMLGCLLLDRGRHNEAIRVFRERHEIDMGDAFPRFLLGLALFLADEDEGEWKPLLQSVARPREWFQGLPDTKAIADKLKMFSHEKTIDPVPYAECLNKLLDFGIPSLVFTFLDQCQILTAEVLANEQIALVDAKAAMLDKKWADAAARLEPLIASKGGQQAVASQEVWRLAGECHFQLQDFEKALQELQYAISFERKFDDPAVYIRWGHVLLLKKRWPKARDAFLRSIHSKPTAEAWSGVGYACYQSQELKECYEALREANLLDNERSDVWAQLCLVHLRFESSELANDCFRQCVKFAPESDELLLDIANECVRRDVLPEVAETAARIAVQLRDSGQGHASLAEAFAKRGEYEKGVLEAQIAIRLLPDRPDERKAIFERALKWTEDLGDAALGESLHAVQRLADQQEVEHYSSTSP